MTPRDRVINAIFSPASNPTPLRLTTPNDEVEKWVCLELARRFPDDLDFLMPERTPMDEWGCFWQPSALGWVPDATPLLERLADLQDVRFPDPRLTDAGEKRVNRFCEHNTRFVLACPDMQPLARLYALLGEELACRSLVRGGTAMTRFLDQLFGFFLDRADAWCKTDVDGICLGDCFSCKPGASDKPSASGKLSAKIPTHTWREYFEPFYLECCRRIRQADKLVYFSAPGDYSDMIPDLADYGVDVFRFSLADVNPGTLANVLGDMSQRRDDLAPLAFHAVLDADWVRDEALETIVRQVYALRTELAGRAGFIAECPVPVATAPRKVAAVATSCFRPVPSEW